MSGSRMEWGEIAYHARLTRWWGESNPRQGDWDKMMSALGRNLAVAGALCKAFDQGNVAWDNLYWTGRAGWEPGCEIKRCAL